MSIIRKATLNDLDKLAVLFDLYRQFYKQESNIIEAKQFLNERIIKNESVIYVAEEENNKLSAFVQLYPFFTSVGMKRSWLLNDLFVKVEFRNKGLAKKLIEQCKLLARETNANGLLLETSINNVEGNALYPSVGFKLERDTNFYFWED
jgi:ribosomal protein S18 acetylase RimI-like enzyme